MEKMQNVVKELGQALKANKRLTEDINRERVLRKKYFNMIEDLKGKIRVYCRLRPLSSTEKVHSGQRSIVDVIDPYTLVVDTPRGAKEFHFDRVFLPNDSQETVFEDTHVRTVSSCASFIWMLFNLCVMCMLHKVKHVY